MMKTRVIPSLLLLDGGLVKTEKFRAPKYVGDPINAIRIFNEKEVDELLLLDIGATTSGKGPDMSTIEDMVGEAFMPVAYGGGVSKVEHARALFSIGIEKVVLNTAAGRTPELINKLADTFGSQSVVVSIDVAKKGILSRYRAMLENGRADSGSDPASLAQDVESRGAGEIVVNSVDRDGSQAGYDLEAIDMVSGAVDIPVIASGGASSLDDFAQAVAHGASAVAAGSMFVYHGPHRAVLISYPERSAMEAVLP